MENKLTINEHIVTVTDDLKHIKVNSLTCMIRFPYTQSNEYSYYLCFSQGENDYDLQQTYIDYAFSCWTEGYDCSPFKHDFTVEDQTPIPDCIQTRVWQTVGVLIKPERSPKHKVSIDITLSQIVNFTEGDAPIHLYRVEKGAYSTKYVLEDYTTLRKRKSPLTIVSFASSSSLVPPGDTVSLTWSLLGEKAIRIHPFMTEFSTNVSCPYEAEITDSTDIVLSARNFEHEEVPEEQRSKVEKALRVVAREPKILSLTLSAPGKPAAEELIVARDVPVTLAWDVSNSGTREITLKPSVKAGKLKPKDSVVITPSDDCVYTLSVAGKQPISASATLRLDEALIREFAPVQTSVMYGEQAFFTYALKNVETASISPGIPSLDITAGRANCIAKPTPTAPTVTYTLSGKGRTPSGMTTQLSRTCTVSIDDYMEIKDFSIKCDTISGDYYIKMFSWNISYPIGEVEIKIYVDDKSLLNYTDRGKLVYTDYINAVFHSNATLVCTGANGQTVKKTITR